MLLVIYPGWHPGYKSIKNSSIYIPEELAAALEWLDTPKRRKLPMAWINLVQ